MIKFIKHTIKLKIFKILERFRVHIYPVAYYSPIPNTRELLKNRKWWFKETDLTTINFNYQKQLYLSKIFSKLQKECEILPSYADLQSRNYGPGYREIDGFILHCFIRHFKPKIVVEIGSGISTFFSSNALSINRKEGKNSRLICIEPYPYQELKNIPFVDKIFEKKVQDIDLEFFQQLNDGDILFIDSSHTVRIGSDVNYLILEVLSSLKKGVIIHFHDIPFPYTFPYPDFWIFDKLMFWQEPVLLKAFLMNNNAFEVIYCSSFLHFKNPELLKETFPKYENDKNFPSSIWIQKIS